MLRRLVVVLCGLPLLFAVLTVSTPDAAVAAGYSVYIHNEPIGINSDGKGKVIADCNSSSTCSGVVHFYGDKVSPEAAGYKPIDVSYSIPARTSKYIYVTMNANSPLNPNRAGNGQVAAGDITKKSGIKLTVVESRPNRASHYYTRTVESKLPGGVQQLEGTIKGAAGSAPVSDVRVRLIEKKRGGVERLAATRNVTLTQQGDGSYTGDYGFGIRVDTNNQAILKYYLKIEGKVAGQSRSWWWRGYDDDYLGGPRYSKDAASVTVQAEEDFNADFSYGFVQGRVRPPADFIESSRAGSFTSYVKAGVDVSIAAPPPNYYGSDARAMQELDIARCANVFAKVKTSSSGQYRADFLPTGGRANENRYMVGARSGGAEVWTGANGVGQNERRYGSCYAATDYQYTRANLLDLKTSRSNVDLALSDPTHIVTVNKPTPAYSAPRQASDYWVTIREKIPGLPILDSPVVKEGYGSDPINGPGKFYVPQGHYWVETGRRTSCSAWYPSVYPDNNAYFQGADRGAERWKTVAGKYPEYQTSYKNGYVARTPPSGYKGWMYRGYCKTLSAGTYNTFSMDSNAGVVPTITRAKRGAVVYGKVTRSGGRTNKEMLVRVSKSDGVAVIRTDLTDSSGKFYIAGLMPGRYTISVNPDSWRGIGRSFSGTKSITVSGSKYSNAGTLKFSG